MLVSNRYAAWADVPSEFLHAELTRREEAYGKPPCGSGKARGSYNTSFHVAALILILVLSTGGKSGPLPLSKELAADEQNRSMLFSDHCAPLSSLSNSSSLFVSLPSLWHWRSHRDCLRASSPNRLCIAHRPLPSLILELWISSHGWPHRNDVGDGSGGN